MASKKTSVPASPFQVFIRTNLLWTVLVLIIVACAGAYLLGYRFGPHMTVAREGTLALTNLPAGTTIYVDQVLQATVMATSTKDIDLVAGDHTVIVSATGDYPWNDLVSITSGETMTLNPIFIAMKPDATPLTGTAKTAALADIASTTLPSEASPLTLANGCAHVYVSNNQIVADAVNAPGCTPPPYLCLSGTCASTIIFSPVDKMSAVFTFPGRQDALLIGLDNVLYAIALDPRSPQFFAPVLTAISPTFGTLADGTIVVGTNTAVFSIQL